MKKLALAYISRTGTTAEIVKTLERSLKEHGFEVEVMGVDELVDVSAFDGIIIGAPINGMQWLPEATECVQRLSTSLKDKKTAFFAVSYIYKDGREVFRKGIRKTLSQPAWGFIPTKSTIFSGRIDKRMPGIVNFIFGIKKTEPLDLVDAQKVKAWADELAVCFDGVGTP